MEEKAPPPSQLGNLEAFLSSSTAIASAAPSALSVTQFRAPINSGFALLQSCPSGARDAFLQLVAILVRIFQTVIRLSIIFLTSQRDLCKQGIHSLKLSKTKDHPGPIGGLE